MTQLIYVIDDEKAMCEVICEVIKRLVPDTRTVCYHDVETFLADPNLDKADLFIIDVSLEHFDGRDLLDLLPDPLRQVPVLFISGVYEDEDLSMIPHDVIFDFAAKPIPSRLLANRIRLLLRVGRQRRAHVRATGSGYWKMIFHAPFLAVVLKDDMSIQACNIQTAQTLGYDDPAELVGRSWYDFLSVQTREVVGEVHKSVMCGDLEKFGEFENEIVSRNGDVVLIKWFNSFLEEERITLSVGIPPRKLLIMREDDIRTYWYDVIIRDRKAILAMQTALKMKGRVVPDDDPTC